MDTKRCSRCGEQLPLDMFYPVKNRKAGYSSHCKKCIAEKNGSKYTPKEQWPEGFRACTKCNEIKPLEEFHKAKNGRFGRDSVCRACSSTAKPKPQAREGYRFCTKCGEEKPATTEFFPVTYKNKSGLDSRCRVCASINARKWHKQKMNEDPEYTKRLYWKDPEKNRAQNRLYYQKNILERRASNVHKYHENLEESRRKNREDYYRHQEERKEKTRQWRQKNPERYREYNRQWADANLKQAKPQYKQETNEDTLEKGICQTVLRWVIGNTV